MVKSDRNLRFALWEAYNHRSAYSNLPILNNGDYSVDHIIPVSTSPEELERKKKLHHLDDDFDVKESIENLLPCLLSENLKKGDVPLEDHTEAMYIAIARKHKVKVLEWKNRFIREHQRLYRNEIDAYHQEQYPTAQRQDFEEFLNVYIGEELDYDSNFYTYSTVNVRILAYLPTIYQEIGSCIIEFNGEFAMIQLSHQQILDLYKTFREKGIMEAVHIMPNTSSAKWYIRIGNVSINISDDYFDDLLRILEHFLLEYSKQYDRFVDFLQLHGFEINEDHTSCILR